MAATIDLGEGGFLIYDAAFLPAAEADAALALLLRIAAWGQETTVFGHRSPRLTAWYADAGLVYRYSRVVHTGAGWPAEVLPIKQGIERAAGQGFNSVLLNLYRNGQDSMGFHSDDEPELGANPVIGSLSLGAVRDFMLKHKETGEKRTYPLEHGSLLIMGGTCQHRWRHGVPRTRRPAGQRLNLTFRRIVSQEGG